MGNSTSERIFRQGKHDDNGLFRSRTADCVDFLLVFSNALTVLLFNRTNPLLVYKRIFVKMLNNRQYQKKDQN